MRNNNLAKILKVMETLQPNEQERVVFFKEAAMLNLRQANKAADQFFDDLSPAEKMCVLYNMGGIFEKIEELSDNAKVSLIQKLILEDTPLKSNSVGGMLEELGVENYEYPDESGGEFGKISSNEDDFDEEAGENGPEDTENLDEEDFEEEDFEESGLLAGGDLD